MGQARIVWAPNQIPNLKLEIRNKFQTQMGKCGKSAGLEACTAMDAAIAACAGWKARTTMDAAIAACAGWKARTTMDAAIAACAGWKARTTRNAFRVRSAG